ncbi:putative hydrolase [Baekduia alba]|uniref:Zn-dependent hydrolase n=1 Tax=Baekduia alba TaxID=2997333 RepID=UPI0023407AC3|nr:Zn-dependent hydrolase [Baekduia alba]WCB91529.1 putative hydrolase [Baekduia alba]
MPSAELTAARPDLVRVLARLDQLWSIAPGPRGGADRPAYSPAEATAMRLVAGWAREAGLAPALDPHGNLWATPPDWVGPLVSSGSHVDTVPDGGRFDGALGTVLALEAAEALREAGDRRGAAPAVLVCAAEEAPRFGAGTLGSRLLTGAVDDTALDGLRDASGTTARSALAGFLDALADLPRVDRVPLERIRAHVEVHVEQRQELARRGAALGVVERVAVPHRHELIVEGRSGHAGEVPMHERHDALTAAAELIVALETAAIAEADPATVATVGEISIDPGAVSAIPRRAVLALEVRGVDPASIARVEHMLDAVIDSVRLRRGVAVERRPLRIGDPVGLDPELVRLALSVAAELGVEARTTYSGAGHDAQHLAAHVPVGMLFVPLHGGESHTPHEGAEPRDIATAAHTLNLLLTHLLLPDQRGTE